MSKEATSIWVPGKKIISRSAVSNRVPSANIANVVLEGVLFHAGQLPDSESDLQHRFGSLPFGML